MSVETDDDFDCIICPECGHESLLADVCVCIECGADIDADDIVQKSEYAEVWRS